MTFSERDITAATRALTRDDESIGRIVSVTGSKAVVMLDGTKTAPASDSYERPEMGTLLAISMPNTTVLAIVTALSVPVPSNLSDGTEIWIAELGLVGELAISRKSGASFNRGVSTYPSLGDRVRVARKDELEQAFCGDKHGVVRVGGIRQDSTIPAMIKVDDLLGKHFAVLGTTGTGKSCTTALIFRAILEHNPNAHIVLLDPHNEYATAFRDWAEIISPRNLQMPYWLLNFEEIVEVLIGDPTGRKTEVETLQELIPIAKQRYHSGRAKETAASAVRRTTETVTRYTVDTPVPYRMSDLTALLDDRLGKLENKRDLAPYRQLKNRIEAISRDARYAFMFGNVTVYDGMAKILGRIFRVPVDRRPITIIELTGLPTEIVNVVVSVLCRMTFDFAVWGDGQVPVTLVCEEAHRYVPAQDGTGFEPCKRAIAKIAKEGRKYGASLCIVTQRPAEIDPTILSQCNTVFALRMTNDRDQQIVQSAVADTGFGLLQFLPALAQREAIAFGDGVPLPVRIRFDDLEEDFLPRSTTARFSERWQTSVGDDEFLARLVERWRTSGEAYDGEQDMTDIGMLADMVDLGEPVRDRTIRRPIEAELSTAHAATFAPPPPAAPPAAPSLRRQPALAPREPVQDGGVAAPRPSLRRQEADPTASEPSPQQQPAEIEPPFQPRSPAAPPPGSTAIPRVARTATGGTPRTIVKPEPTESPGASGLSALRQRLLNR